MDSWKNRWKDEQMHMDNLINDWLHKQINGQTDRWMSGEMDG